METNLNYNRGIRETVETDELLFASEATARNMQPCGQAVH